MVGRSEQARLTAVHADLSSIKTALDAFEVDKRVIIQEHGRICSSSPTTAKNWHGPYLDKVPQDPWGNNYLYYYPPANTTRIPMTCCPSGRTARKDREDDIGQLDNQINDLSGRESRVESRAPKPGVRVANLVTFHVSRFTRPLHTRRTAARPGAAGHHHLVVAPAMSIFIRARAVDSEARRLFALMHAGQRPRGSRKPADDALGGRKTGRLRAYCGNAPSGGDPKAENLTLDEKCADCVLNAGATALTTFQNLPPSAFWRRPLMKTSPQTLRLADAKGNALWLVESAQATLGYEIRRYRQNKGRDASRLRRPIGAAAPTPNKIRLHADRGAGAVLFLAIVIPAAVESAASGQALPAWSPSAKAPRRAWRTGF